MAESLLPPIDAREPDLTVAVPSAWRAGRVLTEQMLSREDFVVVVEERQLAEYQRHQPHLRYEPWPGPEGNISRKWGWMYERFGDVLFLDDDVSRMVHLEHRSGEKQHFLDPDETMEVFRRTAFEASQAGCFLFGYGTGNADVRNFNDLTPFKIKGAHYSITGLLAGSRITFNEEIVGVVDFWMVLTNAFHHRKLWIDLRYEPGGGPKATFRNEGGMARVRTTSSEREDFRILRRYFGDAVELKQKTTRAKVSQEYARTVWIPW